MRKSTQPLLYLAVWQQELSSHSQFLSTTVLAPRAISRVATMKQECIEYDCGRLVVHSISLLPTSNSQQLSAQPGALYSVYIGQMCMYMLTKNDDNLHTAMHGIIFVANDAEFTRTQSESLTEEQARNNTTP
jgi:hypothetical protein